MLERSLKITCKSKRCKERAIKFIDEQETGSGQIRNHRVGQANERSRSRMQGISEASKMLEDSKRSSRGSLMGKSLFGSNPACMLECFAFTLYPLR